MNKGFVSLSVKFILGFLFMGLTISCISINFGYYRFKKSVQKNYNDNAYQIAQIVRTIIPDSEIAEYSEYIRWDIDREKCKEAASSQRYHEIENKLVELREATGANDIYIGYLRTDILKEYAGTKDGWYPLRYIFDVYEVSDLRYTLGDASPINPEFINDCLDFMETGVRPSNFFVSESEYGHNTAAILPIVMDGEVVAIIGVEIPMSAQEAVIRAHVRDTLVIIGIMVLVQMLVYIVWFMAKVVRPLETVSKEAEAFTLETHAEGHAGYTVSDKLLKINTGDEIEELARSLYNMEKYIDSTTRDLISAARESERERSELGIANKIQKDILPSRFPAFPDRHEFDIYASMTPARFVAGDFYDYYFIDEDRLCMVIADVTGKGIPAALFMVIAKTAIKNRAMQGGLPSEILKDVNNQLREGNDTKMFVTAWLGILDTRTGKLIFANAGHEYPVITGEDHRFNYLKDRHGLVMGLKADIEYTDSEADLKKGDTLFVYTDGVLDAQNYDGDAYGPDRLTEVMNGYIGAAPRELVERVLDSVMEYSKDVDQFDDVTMLAFTYLGGREDEPAADVKAKGAELKLDARVENTRKAVDFVRKCLEDRGCEKKHSGKIALAVEELFVNVASYAYPDKPGSVCIKVDFPDNDSARIEMIDEGISYDPSAKEDPDISLPLKKRGKGGMGIFMAKKIMDEMKYKRHEGRNHLVLTKKIR